jgi:hypothetical protein
MYRPTTEVAPSKVAKRKAARRRLSNSNLMILDQAAINAGFAFRRYAMNPTPAKPSIMIAQRLCENSNVELARRKFVSIPLNGKRIALAVSVER